MRTTPFTEAELRDLGMGKGDGSLEAHLASEVSYLRGWMARTARVVEVQTLDVSMPPAPGNEYGQLLAGVTRTVIPDDWRKFSTFQSRGF